MCTLDKEVQETMRAAFRFFMHENTISFSLEPAQIVVGPLQEKHLLTEDKFHDL